MIVEVPKCACGLGMVPASEGADIFVCPNDDTVQPIEHKSGRIKTVQDRRFHLEWEHRKRAYYKEAA